jgi:choline dehydrogenase-like flavoprotein
MTVAITEFENLDRKGHGVKIEAMNMLPAMGMAWQPWWSAESFKARVLEHKHTMGHIVLCRERSPGRLWIDARTGERRIDYQLDPADSAGLLKGYLELAKVLSTTGAEEIYTNAHGGPVWRRSPAAKKAEDWSTDRTFLTFIRRIEAKGIGDCLLGSAHQMGTCKMGSTPETGVVDTCGRVWGTERLYVADASIFPSACGVNPMLTVMTFGELIGRRVASDMTL